MIAQGQDKLVNSPVCDSNACYESEFMTEDGPIKTWLCMTSGYTSNTTMTLDSEALKKTLELTAELIKDLRLDLVPPGGTWSCLKSLINSAVNSNVFLRASLSKVIVVFEV